MGGLNLFQRHVVVLWLVIVWEGTAHAWYVTIASDSTELPLQALRIVLKHVVGVKLRFMAGTDSITIVLHLFDRPSTILVFA